MYKELHPHDMPDKLNMFYFCSELIGQLVLFSILSIIGILFIPFSINFFNMNIIQGDWFEM